MNLVETILYSVGSPTTKVGDKREDAHELEVNNFCEYTIDEIAEDFFGKYDTKNLSLKAPIVGPHLSVFIFRKDKNGKYQPHIKSYIGFLAFGFPDDAAPFEFNETSDKERKAA